MTDAPDIDASFRTPPHARSRTPPRRRQLQQRDSEEKLEHPGRLKCSSSVQEATQKMATHTWTEDFDKALRVNRAAVEIFPIVRSALVEGAMLTQVQVLKRCSSVEPRLAYEALKHLESKASGFFEIRNGQLSRSIGSDSLVVSARLHQEELRIQHAKIEQEKAWAAREVALTALQLDVVRRWMTSHIAATRSASIAAIKLMPVLREAWKQGSMLTDKDVIARCPRLEPSLARAGLEYLASMASGYFFLADGYREGIRYVQRTGESVGWLQITNRIRADRAKLGDSAFALPALASGVRWPTSLNFVSKTRHSEELTTSCLPLAVLAPSTLTPCESSTESELTSGAMTPKRRKLTLQRSGTPTKRPHVSNCEPSKCKAFVVDDSNSYGYVALERE